MHEKPRRQQRSESEGFTLVELLIVIVILGVLAVVTVFAVRGITDEGQENSEAEDLRILQTANEAHWLDEGTNATEEELVDKGYITRPSPMFDLAVDGSGVLTITNTRTGTVAGTVGANDGGTGGSGSGTGTVGSLEGLVKNATNEAPIAGVNVCVRAGSLCDTTDGSGTYAIADVPTGAQTIDFTAPGFTTFDETAMITDGAPTTLNTAMSPQLAAGDLRIVVTWGENPSDLDSYLHLPGGGSVSYSNTGALASAPFAKLDADDTDGFGPETITISQLNSGNYSFAVKSHSGGSFVPAETTVRVYDVDGLVREFTPPAGTGVWWRVFKLDGATGNLTAVNTIASDAGPF